MSTETTSDYRQTMNLTQLPESELFRMLSDCRITLESIRPYRDKATSAFQARLRNEIKRRESDTKQFRDFLKANHVAAPEPYEWLNGEAWYRGEPIENRATENESRAIAQMREAIKRESRYVPINTLK